MQIIRWLLFVPASILASKLFAGLGPFLFSLGGLIDLQDPSYPEFLFPFTYLLFSGLAFSVVGAMVTPQHRVWAACGLSLFCIAASWYTHVLTQDPTSHHYMISIGETVGAMLGVATVVLLAQKNKSIPNQGQD